MFYAALDVSLRSVAVCIIDEAGEVRLERSVPSEVPDLVRCLHEFGSPWENGYCESFNSKLRDELLDGEIFFSLAEAQILIEAWRRHYNGVRPHSSLGYRPPAPESFVPSSGGIVPWASAPARLKSARPPTPTVASELAMN